MSFLGSLTHWLVETLEPYGAPGLMLIAIGDSSFLSLPEVNDAALMAMSINNPYRMWELAAVTVLGSVIGCSLLYAVGRKGGEALLRRRFAPDKVQKVRGWYQKYGMLAVIVPSLLPPPLPFKIFVLSAGAFQISWSRFVLAVAIGRSIRYFTEGILAVWYGKQAVQIVADNFAIAGVVLASLIVVAAVLWILLRRRKVSASMVLLPLLLFILSGCVTKVSVPPTQRIAKSYPFSEEQALQKLATMSSAIQTLKASIQVEPSTATKDPSKRVKAPSFSATLIVKREGGIFLKGKKIVDLFEMKSDGTNYQFFVDQSNQLYLGTENAPPSKPFAHIHDDLVNQFVNLRPKQLQDALMVDVRPLLTNSSGIIRFLSYQLEQEVTEQRWYSLFNLVDNSSSKPYLVQRIWFDLSTENADVVRRQTYDRSGHIESDTRYSNYQFVSGGLRFPMSIDLQFPATQTTLAITFPDPTGVAFNSEVPAEVFVLDPHPGARVYKFEPLDAVSVSQQR